MLSQKIGLGLASCHRMLLTSFLMSGRQVDVITFRQWRLGRRWRSLKGPISAWCLPTAYRDRWTGRCVADY